MQMFVCYIFINLNDFHKKCRSAKQNFIIVGIQELL